MKELPSANDQNIQLIELNNSEDFACIQFNMSMNSQRNAEKEKELRDLCQKDGIQLSTNRNDIRYFGYNAPFTIPYFRRNEISIPIISK